MQCPRFQWNSGQPDEGCLPSLVKTRPSSVHEAHTARRASRPGTALCSLPLSLLQLCLGRWGPRVGGGWEMAAAAPSGPWSLLKALGPASLPPSLPTVWLRPSWSARRLEKATLQVPKAVC